MRRQKGFSLIELLIVVTIILIIAAIALPSLLRARIAANDAAAATTLRTLNTAEITYSTTYATSGFAPSLAVLGPAGTTCGAPTSAGACLIDNVLGCSADPCFKGGYEYFLLSSSSASPFGDYTASATPITVGQTGSRNWCSNPDAVVRMSPISPAQLTSGETKANCEDTSKYSATNFS